MKASLKTHFLSVTTAGLAVLSAGPRIQAATEPAKSNAEQVEFFEKKVRPILVSHCYACHSADTKTGGGLRVDDRNGLFEGGNAGPGVVPGEPEKSLILSRIRHDDPKKKMPKEGEPLNDTEIADLTTWIKDGAAWPQEKLPVALGTAKAAYASLKSTHWAWQPLSDPKTPTVTNTAWPSGDIDRFVLAKLEGKGLSPVADADPISLIRRVTFDLTGLPPAAGDISAFLKDSSPQAFAHVVDRLLASSQFGERWGRHWLDVARYGESTGPSRNIPYPHAWKYRDYVIDAVNKDVPFDKFVQEQIAGDLLPASSTAERDHLLTATGFLALGGKDVNQRFKIRFVMDNVDEQIDTVSRSVLGLTVSCARCHDHKFDPIPTTDYYAMAGIFTSTDNKSGLRNKMGGGGLDYYDPKMLVTLASDVPAASSEQIEKLQAQVDEAKKAWDAIRGTPEGLKLAADGKPTQRSYRVKYEKLQGDLLQLTDPGSRGYAVHGVGESSRIGDTEVRIRGEAERLGPTVPRGFLTAFEVPHSPSINREQSGRLELARWLTSPKNPLTSRVIVNRVWQHLFGDGIVTTVDNFGVKGDVPSHPELLDYLANEFILNDWSVKKLVRTIVLSHAYRLGTEASGKEREIDPANRFVWRHSPRRLEAEEIRDAMLLTAGQLQPRPTNGSPARELKMIEMRDNGLEARNIHEAADDARYRSIYLPLLRGVTPASLEAFDPVAQSLVTGQRETTTVPTQALYLLNSAFVRHQSLALADRLLAESDPSDIDRIRKAYWLTLGRPPAQHEVDRAVEFISSYETAFLGSPDAKLPEIVQAPVKAAKPIAVVVPANADDIDTTSELAPEETVRPRNAKTAAWMSFTQSLYASAEFRFVR